MSDVNANIDININSSNALAQLKSLQRQIAQFHTSIAKSSESAALAQKGLQKNLLSSVNAIGAFSAEMRTVKTSAESFTNSLEKNKFSMREYFRYAGASTKTFGRLFKSEFDTIGKVSEERVKRLQTQFIKMGRDTNGAMQAMAIMPTKLNMEDYTTKVQLAAQKQALFNQLMKQGSTNLLNFGKNTQWAGRQLMVGFTLPLMAVGTAATKTFMEMEAQAIKFKKVYGDLFTPQEETQQALSDITELGKQFTRYGIAVSTTVGLAAEAAAAGFSGLDLQRQTTEATRLSILGQLESQKALETTISLQNAFGMSSEKLAESIDFLNAVENQTVVSLDDITTAIPKVAPVIQQLGGDVKDLTFFMAAMKEGGINASEGANALKSGLGSLINPGGKASAMLKSFGINAEEIVTKNKGNLKATVIEFAEALNALDPLNRAQVIEQMFGKFQFARLSTLFANVAKDGNQAARVLNLANSSVEELSALSEKELGMTAESSMNKFKKAVEDLKVALIPVGEAFLQAVTPIVEFVGNILEKFANLSDGTKKVITLLTVGIGAVGPVLLMTFGLLANGVANIIKLFLTLRGGYQRLTGQSQILGEQTQYMTMEQLDAAAAAHSLNQTHATLTQTFTAEANAIKQLIAAYSSAASASANFARANPGMMMPGRGRGYADGVVSVPGPKGAGDIIPAMLSPGEAVVPADMAKKYAPLIQGMIAGNIPGFAKGRTGQSGTNVKIPGGFAAAHFGGSNQMSGNDLLSMLEGRSDKMAESLRKMVASMSDADEMLTVFSNEVVATTSDLNEAVGKTGSGKKVSMEYARNEMLDPQYANVRDIELQRQLEAAGKPIEEIRVVNEKITKEIAIGFDKLKDKTVVTAEDLDKVISEAYQAIAKTDKDVEAAYARMKEITTVTDPNLLTRRPVTKTSYKDFRRNNKKTKTSPYYEGMQRMVGEGNVPYSPEANFRITNPMAEQIGMSSKDASRIYEQFSKEVKLKLSQLRGDITKFTAEFKKEAELAGLKTGQAYQAGIEKSNLKDVYVESRERQSPHPLAAKDGADDAKAYENARSTVAQKTRGSGRGNRGVTKPAGSPLSSGIAISDPALLAMAYQENTMRDKLKKQSEVTQVMNQRMDKLNRNFMAGTFAISALSGVASMAGGNLGKFSEILFQISGPMFALSSVIQLLTGNKIVGQIFKFKKILGPVAIGLTALTFGIKAYNKSREEEIQRIDGLGNAALLTSDKIKNLGDFFGIVPTKSGYESKGPELSLKKEERTKVDVLKETESFQKDFAKDIKRLSSATGKQAEVIFKTLQVQLKGRGFAEAQIKTIIQALQEEAGKTNVQVDFGSLDLATESGQKNLSEIAQSLGKNFAKEFDRGYKKEVWEKTDPLSGEIYYEEVVTMSEGLRKSLSTTSKTLAGLLDGISAQFKNGSINAQQFNQSFSNIVNTIKSFPEPKAIVLLDGIFTSLPGDLAKTATGFKSVATQLLILEGLAFGLVTAELISSLKVLESSTKAYDRQEAVRIKDKLANSITSAKITKDEIERLQDEADARAAAAEAGKENPIAKRIKDIKQQTDAYKILRNANVDNTTATELSNDSEIAALVIANSKGKKLKDLIKLINQYKNAIKAQTKAAEENMSEEEKFKANITRTLALANLREKLIDIEYAGQIQKENDTLNAQEKALQGVNDEIDSITKKQIAPIEKIINANSFALEKISLQEDIINEQYETQISALEKIETLNQDIANTQKQRLTIADALTRGDISAAAAAIQDSRAQAADSAVSRQRDALGAGKDIAINALGRKELEQQNKKLQYDISVIENGRLLTLKEQKSTIEDQIDATQRAIAKIELQVETLKNAAVYAGQTRKAFEDQDELIGLAEAAGIKYNAELIKQLANAQGIQKAIEALDTTVKTIHIIETRHTSGGGGGEPAKEEEKKKTDSKTDTNKDKTEEKPKAPVKPPVTPKEAERKTPLSGINFDSIIRQDKAMENRNPLKKALGGFVPKYFARGGMAIGSDTIPAMLTPGEFIVNKAAASAYGPMLKTLNESKYPSMLGENSSPVVPIVNNSTSLSDNSTAVYNYTLGFNINGSTSNPNDIARAVIKEIKQIDSQRIRGSRR